MGSGRQAAECSLPRGDSGTRAPPLRGSAGFLTLEASCGSSASSLWLLCLWLCAEERWMGVRGCQGQACWEPFLLSLIFHWSVLSYMAVSPTVRLGYVLSVIRRKREWGGKHVAWPWPHWNTKMTHTAFCKCGIFKSFVGLWP